MSILLFYGMINIERFSFYRINKSLGKFSLGCDFQNVKILKCYPKAVYLFSVLNFPTSISACSVYCTRKNLMIYKCTCSSGICLLLLYDKWPFLVANFQIFLKSWCIIWLSNMEIYLQRYTRELLILNVSDNFFSFNTSILGVFSLGFVGAQMHPLIRRGLG